MNVNRYRRVAKAACVASVIAAGLGALSTPVAGADSGVGAAPLEAEASYLADLNDYGISVGEDNAIDLVNMGYLTCLIRQLNGSSADIDSPPADGEWSDYFKAANRNLCDYVPSLPQAKADADRDAAMEIVSEQIFNGQYADVQNKVDDIVQNRPSTDTLPDGF